MAVANAGLDDSSRTHISRRVRSCGNFDILEYGARSWVTWTETEFSVSFRARPVRLRFSMTPAVSPTIEIRLFVVFAPFESTRFSPPSCTVALTKTDWSVESDRPWSRHMSALIAAIVPHYMALSLFLRGLRRAASLLFRSINSPSSSHLSKKGKRFVLLIRDSCVRNFLFPQAANIPTNYRSWPFCE